MKLLQTTNVLLLSLSLVLGTSQLLKADASCSSLWEDAEQWKKLSGREKERCTMELVESPPEEGKNASFPTWETFNLMLKDDLVPIVEHDYDSRPYDHDKRIHSVGYTSSVEFVSKGNHKYSGLFKGAPYGIVRFSSGSNPNKDIITPALAIKFFRDGKTSANFMAMFNLVGQSSLNFFENDFASHVPDLPKFTINPTKLILKWMEIAFRQASSQTGMVGLSDLATTHANGVPVAEDDIEYPFKLILKPNPVLKEKFKKKNKEEFNKYLLRDTLDEIDPKTILYEVYAQASPCDDAPQLIGELKLKEKKIVESQFGDTKLFFRHQRMEDDFMKHKEWADYVLPNQSKKCPMLHRLTNEF